MALGSALPIVAFAVVGSFGASANVAAANLRGSQPELANETVLESSILAADSIMGCRKVTAQRYPNGFRHTCAQEDCHHWRYQTSQCWPSMTPRCKKEAAEVAGQIGGFKPWACDGPRQSPITIDESAVSLDYTHIDLAKDMRYKTARRSALEVKNTGHSLEVDLTDMGGIWLDGEWYDVLQLHVHALSEHWFKRGGGTYGEMHVVHKKRSCRSQDDPGCRLVLGVMLNFPINCVGTQTQPSCFRNPSAILEAMGLPGSPPAEHTSVQSRAALDLNSELAAVFSEGFYRYSGSLTTPPCTENVEWLLAVAQMSGSPSQLTELSCAIESKRTWRDAQDVGSRVVHKNAPR